MKTKKFQFTKKRVILGILALLFLLRLIYTWPMTPKQFCPQLDFSKCTEIYSYYVPNRADEELTKYSVYPGDPEFQQFIDLFENRTFRRSLSALNPFPFSNLNLIRRSTSVQSWYVRFYFEGEKLPDGTTDTVVFDCITHGDLSLNIGYSISSDNLKRVPCIFRGGKLFWTNKVLELTKAVKAARS